MISLCKEAGDYRERQCGVINENENRANKITKTMGDVNRSPFQIKGIFKAGENATSYWRSLEKKCLQLLYNRPKLSASILN